MNLEEIAKSVGDEPFYAQQKWTELKDLLEFLAPRKPKNILEIGVYKGGTIKAWTHIADDNARIIGMDLPGGEFGGGFTPEEHYGIEALARANQKIRLYPGNSHDKGMVAVIKRYGPFDFIFIDGDHTYAGVSQDYLNYYPMLADGGVMAFHDIVDHTINTDVQVRKLWLELKKRHKWNESIDLDFITDHGSWGGIGVIIK